MIIKLIAFSETIINFHSIQHICLIAFPHLTIYKINSPLSKRKREKREVFEKLNPKYPKNEKRQGGVEKFILDCIALKTI